MDDAKFKKEIGDTVINKCIEALGRIRAGIQLLVEDDTAFDAFCFMNRSMILQRNIMNFSKKHGAGIECAFRDFVDPRDPSNNFGWRPFQIAFILMNLKGIVDPEHDNREVVDLLYFPTGGGKTEAYLGLMAFVIANRRLRAEENDEYNRDGGVTAILRYTLRLLTTQQRDRITKMILAAELIRQKEYPKYGKEPISIGFWVGGTVTPNTFKELEEAPEDPAKTRIARSKKNSIYKQLLTCPFCGKPLTEENFYIDIPTKSVSIYCSDDKCMFYRYKPSNKIKIPVYLVDEEIYAKCPTIILSTVDKFARLPWDVNTNALFGRVDRICSRDGYVAIGADHARHNRTEELPTSTLRSIKPFLPPELIIQDELHLITGPLGTVYGAYETVIEDLCSYTIGEKKIKPKYVVSTATIKNAAEQTKCLYGRKVTAQFPPNGFEIGDSFYIREVPVEQDPFRRYVGVCAPGQSVKTALLRVYSIILQSAYNLSLDDEYKDVIDPYYTLVGYYNSIRELGGAVRLLQDDIPDRIQRIKKKYGMSRQCFLNHKVEITSRMTKEEIQASIKSIMFSGSVCGIEIYACLRDESGYQTKKIRATDKLLSSTKDKVAGFINCTYLADDAEFDTSENIADNKKEFYEISLIENYRPFIFLDDAEKRTEYYSESDRNKLSGFLFRINLNDKYFWVYQHIYSVSRIDRSKNVIALFVGDTYDEIDSDIVQIDSRADVIIFSSSVVTAKMDLMQRFFGFEQYIRAGAQKTIEIIRDLDIVDSLEKFVAFENKSKLTNAKKLLKAKNSPVLQMKKNDLLENLKKHSRYKTMFKFEEDHIVISSQKEAAAFIKMLNDDIVRSELTGKEYDSSSKMLLGPVGASH